MIDELQRVKDFGSSEPPPSETARNAARSALAQAIADAEPQHRQAPVPLSRRRFRWYAGGARRLVPIGAAVALATAVALFLTTPWTSSPGFLERAEAALTPPQDMILHAKLAETDCSGRWTAQIWVDEHTHRYRGLFHDPFLPYPFRYFTLEEIRAGLCNVRASTYEAGVVLGPRNVCCGRHNTLLHSFVPLRFVPPNKLIRFPGPGFARASANPTIFGTVPALDPVAELRRAIRSGLAHDQGRTTLNGRTAERIRIDPCPPKSAFTDPSPCTDLVWSSGGGYAYVDPETYHPIEIRPGGGVIRFATYEYLPRTAANLALTNIRAQHPHARLTDR